MEIFIACSACCIFQSNSQNDIIIIIIIIIIIMGFSKLKKKKTEERIKLCHELTKAAVKQIINQVWREEEIWGCTYDIILLEQHALFLWDE